MMRWEDDMTIQDLGALGEFLGSIVVLVTLGYLALQTRQNTLAIAAQEVRSAEDETLDRDSPVWVSWPDDAVIVLGGG